MGEAPERFDPLERTLRVGWRPEGLDEEQAEVSLWRQSYGAHDSAYVNGGPDIGLVVQVLARGRGVEGFLPFTLKGGLASTDPVRTSVFVDDSGTGPGGERWSATVSLVDDAAAVKPDALVYGYSGPGVTVDSLLRPSDPSGRTHWDPDEGNTTLDGRSVWLADDRQALTVWDLRGTRLFVRNKTARVMRWPSTVM